VAGPDTPVASTDAAEAGPGVPAVSPEGAQG
jgi:hypothetical protein